MDLLEISNHVVRGIEATGIVVIVTGMMATCAHALWRFVRDRNAEEAYERVRKGVGRSLLLGLDLLIASEIIRSTMAETLESVTVLGLTVVIRIVLSLTLEVEIEGQFPWQRKRNSAAADARPE